MKYLVSILGLGLLLVFVTSLVESSLANYGANATIDDEGGNGLQKNASCLILCNYCGCDGSFEGDDCICDCGIDGEERKFSVHGVVQLSVDLSNGFFVFDVPPNRCQMLGKVRFQPGTGAL